MRLIFGLFILLFSYQVLANSIYCKNVDEVFKNDTLEFFTEGKTTYAYYANSDDAYKIPCETTASDTLYCDDAGKLVTLYESGEATVENGIYDEVEFTCN